MCACVREESQENQTVVQLNGGPPATSVRAVYTV